MTHPTLRKLPVKTLTLPLSGTVDISPFLPLIDHPRFQMLRYRRQLGLVHLTFPGATHTRFEHSIGTAQLMRQLAPSLPLDDDVRRDLVLYALLHDLGHAPFSHQTEPLFHENHRERGRRLARELDAEVRACEGDPDVLDALFAEELPDYQLVEDRNLGADKLDYLARDAYHVGLAGAPQVEKLQAYLVFVDGRIALEEKLIEEVKRAQSFYSYLYRQVYLNKQSLIVQRMLQRAVETWVREAEIGEEEVLNATDGAVEYRLSACPVPEVERIWRRLHDRRILRSAVVVRIRGYEDLERRARKPLEIIGIDEPRFLEVLAAFDDPRRATELEDRIAEVLGSEPGDVALAARQFFTKLRPRDVMLYSQQTGEIDSLFSRDPLHEESLTREYLSLFALRVAVPEEKRELARERWQDIVDLLLP